MTPQCWFSFCDFEGRRDWAEAMVIFFSFGPYLCFGLFPSEFQSFGSSPSTLFLGLLLLCFMPSKWDQIVQHIPSFCSFSSVFPHNNFGAMEIHTIPPPISWSSTLSVMLSSLAKTLSFPFSPPHFDLYHITSAVLSWRRTLAHGAARESRTAQNYPSVSWHLLLVKEIIQESEWETQRKSCWATTEFAHWYPSIFPSVLLPWSESF